MRAYEDGGHAYHATLPTDGLLRLHASMQQTLQFGLETARAAQQDLGRKVRALLAGMNFHSVAAPGFEAPSVVVSHTDDPELSNARRTAAAGLQTAAGVPLMCDEPADFRSFRIGLFGLDKWQDVDGTVQRLQAGLASLR
jgi:aspartate aminotransferase-like enzyme